MIRPHAQAIRDDSYDRRRSTGDHTVIAPGARQGSEAVRLRAGGGVYEGPEDVVRRHSRWRTDRGLSGIRDPRTRPRAGSQLIDRRDIWNASRGYPPPLVVDPLTQRTTPAGGLLDPRRLVMVSVLGAPIRGPVGNVLGPRVDPPQHPVYPTAQDTKGGAGVFNWGVAWDSRGNRMQYEDRAYLRFGPHGEQIVIGGPRPVLDPYGNGSGQRSGYLGGSAPGAPVMPPL